MADMAFLCWLLRGHKYRFVRRSLEGARVFRCQRCGKWYESTRG